MHQYFLKNPSARCSSWQRNHYNDSAHEEQIRIQEYAGFQPLPEGNHTPVVADPGRAGLHAGPALFYTRLFYSSRRIIAPFCSIQGHGDPHRYYAVPDSENYEAEYALLHPWVYLHPDCRRRNCINDGRPWWIRYAIF